MGSYKRLINCASKATEEKEISAESKSVLVGAKE